MFGFGGFCLCLVNIAVLFGDSTRPHFPIVFLISLAIFVVVDSLEDKEGDDCDGDGFA